MEIQVENRLQLPTDSTDEAFVLIDVDGNRRIPKKNQFSGWSGGSTKSPSGFVGSRRFVLHFCNVPLILLTAVGSGLRPAMNS
jgi:hypothetical protein